MSARRLGTTDIEITPIGLGCLQFSNGGIVSRQVYPAMDQAVAGEVVRAAIDGGIDWFDTAEMYGQGHSERLLARALRSNGIKPEDTVIATKWTPVPRTAGNITRTFGNRETALSGYPVSLHQIHFNAAQMEKAHACLAARGIALASNQVQVSLLHRSIEHNGVLETARRLGITLIASSPLHMGR